MITDPSAAEAERNFQALKRHAFFPFPDYRKNGEHYMLLEMYWTYLFKAAIGGNADESWKAGPFPDALREGDPIFCAVNIPAGLGTRVTQHPEAPLPNEAVPLGYFGFQPFLSRGPADPRQPDQTILQLCFIADVSESTEAWCRKFWKNFCVNRLSEVEMEERILRYEETVGMPE
jgi:hypothetical protein